MQPTCSAGDSLLKNLVSPATPKHSTFDNSRLFEISPGVTHQDDNEDEIKTRRAIDCYWVFSSVCYLALSVTAVVLPILALSKRSELVPLDFALEIEKAVWNSAIAVEIIAIQSYRFCKRNQRLNRTALNGELTCVSLIGAIATCVLSIAPIFHSGASFTPSYKRLSPFTMALGGIQLVGCCIAYNTIIAGCVSINNAVGSLCKRSFKLCNGTS